MVSSNCSNVSHKNELDLDSIFDEQLSQVDISIPLLPDKRQCGVDIEIGKLTRSVNSNTSESPVSNHIYHVIIHWVHNVLWFIVSHPLSNHIYGNC